MALTTNLVSYWKLDESSGNAADSVGGNTLTNTNSVPFVSGKINNGADLEAGSSQFFTITDAAQSGLDLDTDFSFSGWVKFESMPASGGEMVLMGKRAGGNGYTLSLYNNAGAFSWTATIQAGSVEMSTTAPSTGVFHHIVYTYVKSTGAIKVYVDGVLNTSGTGGTTLAGSTSDFFLGVEAGGTVCFMDGVMDEVGIWSRVLTSSEVQELYNSNSGLAYPLAAKTLFTSLLSYYKFDNVNDAVGGKTLTNVGSVAFNAGGLFGNDADFGATNTSKSLKLIGDNSGIAFDAPITISLWVKLHANVDGTNTYYGFMNKMAVSTGSSGVEYQMGTEYNSGTPRIWMARFGSANTYHYSTITLGTTTWHHMVLTWDTTSFRAYLDGTLIGTTANSGVASIGTETHLIFGQYENIDSGWLRGMDDEAGLWNRAITTDEVTALYNAGAGVQPSFTNLKTIMGIAYASVKTVAGIAIASVKSVAGIQ